jgi:hypothetical protein
MQVNKHENVKMDFPQTKQRFYWSGQSYRSCWSDFTSVNGGLALGRQALFANSLPFVVSEISHLQLAPALTTTYNTFRLLLNKGDPVRLSPAGENFEFYS